MLKTRIIPCLLVMNNGLVKTVKFKNPSYVGDPINAIRIYNDKEVDELILLDISATQENKEPNYKLISDAASECFMPLTYGGGIKTLDQAKKIFEIGVEKLSLNNSAYEKPELISRIASAYGTQSVIASIDIKKNMWGRYDVVLQRATKSVGVAPIEYAKQLESLGAGEIMLTSVDREGTWEGYHLEILQKVSSAVNIPVICNGGAGKLEHIREAVFNGGASGVAIGSMAVYQRKGRGVLINFPARHEIEKLSQE